MEFGRKIDKPTIFQSLLTPNPSQGHVVTAVKQLKDEAYSILGAASNTTGNAITVAAYEVILDPAKYKKLTDELRAASPDPHLRLDLLTLEKLPYLVSEL